ncbi:MAG: hypothetical protein A2X88_01840 [Deltaproteobacteria bacterium GWC2_65_14]|nr:MAG: hypothetical protein A2X88_01840 [Deltaproteobacteria bacterium GWC2_65_14]
MLLPRERSAPRRTCVTCGRTGEKGSFLRIAGRPGERWEIDPEGRRPGRGIYLCRAEACVRGLSRRLGTRKGAGRWRMGTHAVALAGELETWWSSREE